MLTFKVKNIEVLKRRSKYGLPCNKDWKHDDEKIMEAIEEWETSVKILQQHGAAYQISSLAKLNALEVLMSNKASVYESIERSIVTNNPDDKFTAMMGKLREYAAKQRWNHQHKKGNGDAMDIGELQKEIDKY